MKLETLDEIAAFEFVCAYASEAMSSRVCDDLDEEGIKLFGHLQVERGTPEGEVFFDKVVFGGDVVQWLREQAKKVN